MVEPVRDSAAVVLKNADRAVIVPSRGTENAKFVNVPAAFVRSIVAPSTLTLGALLPKPISDGMPARPPAMVVIVNGVPDEKGIIAEEPATPVGPVAPVIPAVPVAPVAPVAPVGPVGPVIPFAPVGPVGPVMPFAPVGPVGPIKPFAPVGPVGPVMPFAPVGPVGPAVPLAPVAPVGPVGPAGMVKSSCAPLGVNVSSTFA